MKTIIEGIVIGGLVVMASLYYIRVEDRYSATEARFSKVTHALKIIGDIEDTMQKENACAHLKLACLTLVTQAATGKFEITKEEVSSCSVDQKKCAVLGYTW